MEKIASDNADVGVTGICSTSTKLSCSFAFEKQLNVTFVKNGNSNVQASINLLAQKAIDLSYFKLPIYKFEYAPKHFDNALNRIEENEQAEFLIDML